MADSKELPKIYNASLVEDKIYRAWEKSGVFHPDNLPERNQAGDPYCIVMPPPNRTGTLHLGHASMLAIEDLLIRFHRMQGKRTLWIPGTDHAAIATQVKVEQELVKQGMKDPRRELGREKFLEKVIEFAEDSAQTIRSQIRKMGSSCDWSRERYTLDESRSRAVFEVFKRMYEDGLIERGYRIVNWDPQFQTTLSDDEVETKEVTAKLLTFKYDKDFPIAISTTRPETKFGDTAVAVHPDDKRYKKFVGKTFTPTFCGKKLTIRIIADDVVDPTFGTGALGVTPAHSMVDAELAERHGLAAIPVIGTDAKLLAEAGKEFVGLTTLEARQKVEKILRDSRLLQKVEDVLQNLPIAQRGGASVEQLPMRQWFIRVNKTFTLRQDTLAPPLQSEAVGGFKKDEQVTLKQLMREAVASQQIRIIPERFKKNYFHWIDNLRDWCISRQIWFGHRIPVWYRTSPQTSLHKKERGEEETVISIASPGPDWEQDPDTLDTWFSAGLWTFSALGWPLTRIIFVRHGEARGNAEQLNDDGSAGFQNNLTARGCAQVEKTAKHLKALSVNALFSSPLDRTRQTAQILSQELGLPVMYDDRLRELGLGPYSGKPADQYTGDRSFDAWVAGTQTLLHTESYADLKRRTFGFLREMLQAHAGETIAIISHGDPIALMATYGTQETWAKNYPELGGTLSITIDTEGRQSDDLARYHPTAVLETGYDILFFWVARMILMSSYVIGEAPFKDVYLHGLVRDEEGRKMSKSLGNVIDPLDMIARYGTDAVRLSLVMGTTPGQDVKLSESKIEGLRNFTNKLWNIGRFIISQTSPSTPLLTSPSPLLRKEGVRNVPRMKGDHGGSSLADRWILSRLSEVTASVTEKLNRYEFSSAGEELRDFTWNDFADWYLEIAKIHMKNAAVGAQPVVPLRHILETILKLWHPFMPFVTEELWRRAGFDGQLIVTEWPNVVGATRRVAPTTGGFDILRTLITNIRHLRVEQKIEPTRSLEIVLIADKVTRELVEENIEIIKHLARVSSVQFVQEIGEDWATAVSGKTTIGINAAGTVDGAVERAKSEKEIAQLDAYIASQKKKLAKKEFLMKAPRKVVDGMRQKLAEAEGKREALKQYKK